VRDTKWLNSFFILFIFAFVYKRNEAKHEAKKNIRNKKNIEKETKISFSDIIQHKATIKRQKDIFKLKSQF